MSVQLSFYGGVGTVTGSKYLVEADGIRCLVDCGLFQGQKRLRERNWAAMPFEPAKLDAVILTHAHLDHSGYLPLLARNGFRGPVICTDGTRDLCKILLTDSGYLQERDAEFANRHGYSKHKQAKPLYTADDAKACLRLFRSVASGDKSELAGGANVRFYPSGHILGAAFVELEVSGQKILFSGDLGRPNSATMVDPTPISSADYLVVESTYGNRRHERTEPASVLADIISTTAARGGTILIPAFAVGRAQTILYYMQQLKADGAIPDLPVFLDSPMAINASEIFCRHLNEQRLSAEQCRALCDVAKYVRLTEDSKALDENTMPKIIISASGMATGGRILHHLKFFARDHRNTVLFTGFQASGTRGAAMSGGAPSVKIHGKQVRINADVHNLHMLSAHADCDEILAWLHQFKQPPKQTFITHGEPDASQALKEAIEADLAWHCSVPGYTDRVALN